jgi:N-acyl-D-aspartate/D-glutamate deacylase
MRDLEGKTVGEIARRDGQHVIDTLLDLACAADLRTEFQTTFLTPTTPERMRTLIRYRYSLPGISDGGAHTKFFVSGNYTTHFLTQWVREHEFIDLEEAHWRLAAYPAYVAGVGARGFLREGAPADIVVYDFDQLALLPVERTYDFPAGEWRLTQKAAGYRYTIVNGEVTFVESQPTDRFPGRVLRYGADLTAA